MSFPEDETGLPPDPAENEARWDELYGENRRKQERMERTLEEQMLLGVDSREALEAAIEEATLRIDEDDDVDDEQVESFADDADESAEMDEPWREGLPAAEDVSDEFSDKSFEERFQDPLHERARSLWMRLHDVAEQAGERSRNVDLRNAQCGRDRGRVRPGSAPAAAV